MNAALHVVILQLIRLPGGYTSKITGRINGRLDVCLFR